MRKRSRRGACLLLVATLLSGCGALGSQSSNSCAASELTWERATARAGESAVVEGRYLMADCNDTGTGQNTPLTGLRLTLLSNGEPVELQPEQAGPLDPDGGGALRAQVTLPPTAEPGSTFEVELSGPDGVVARSDGLTITD